MSSRGIEGNSECLPMPRLEWGGGDNGFQLAIPAFFMMRDRAGDVIGLMAPLSVSCVSSVLAAFQGCTFADSTVGEYVTKDAPYFQRVKLMKGEMC